MDNNRDTFTYTYSARQQEEIKRIRSKYTEPEEDKMDQLRRIDSRVTQKAQAWAIAVGVIGTLIMGAGMSIAMTDLTGFVGGTAMIVGIPVGVVGMLLVGAAYPIYRYILKKERKRMAPEILRLTDELMK